MRSSIRLAAVTVSAAAMVGASATAASAGPRGGDSLSQATIQSCLSVDQEAEAETERSIFSDAEAENNATFIFFGPFVCTQVAPQVVAPVTVFGDGNTAGWEADAEAAGEAVDLDIEAPGNGVLPPEILSAQDINAQTSRMVEGVLADAGARPQPAAGIESAQPVAGTGMEQPVAGTGMEQPVAGADMLRPDQGVAPMADAELAR
ncbi:hypothetical protein GCM10009716_37410 [Streptomyces sodiiphilus]|uniref:Uncharacterized protein n=1 Tax=Streptomyces sodiiphilus TaxID=226217 RepID=A0ABN2PNB3_9ACTN